MSTIIPAIIPTSEADLIEAVAQIPFAARIQIDVVDGVFASPASWPYVQGGTLTAAASLCSERRVMVDLMVSDPLAAAREWLRVGAKELVVHLETVSDFAAFVALKQEFDFLLYIAGDDDVAIAVYSQYLAMIDGVQLMGIPEVGTQGQPLSSRVLANIAAMRAAHPALPIVIDGSVNENTIVSMKTAGANDFVVGSAIMGQADKERAYQILTALVE